MMGTEELLLAGMAGLGVAISTVCTALAMLWKKNNAHRDRIEEVFIQVLDTNKAVNGRKANQQPISKDVEDIAMDMPLVLEKLTELMSHLRRVESDVESSTTNTIRGDLKIIAEQRDAKVKKIEDDIEHIKETLALLLKNHAQ